MPDRPDAYVQALESVIDAARTLCRASFSKANTHSELLALMDALVELDQVKAE